jgi:hypothetical protein
MLFISSVSYYSSFTVASDCRNLLGLFSSGTELDTIVIAPLIRPDAPIPATARPIINITDDCAAPQSAEPNSKMAKKLMNDHYRAVYQLNASS